MVPSSTVLESLSEQLNTLHCKLDWLGGKIQCLETQNIILQTENRIKDGKIESLQTQVNDLQGQVTTLKAKAYQPDLRGILNLFHRKVITLLYYIVLYCILIALRSFKRGWAGIKSRWNALPPPLVRFSRSS